jgi:Uncharacterised protein family (UPF0175)
LLIDSVAGRPEERRVRIFLLGGRPKKRLYSRLKALALAAYREPKISAAQLRQLLGYETRMEVDAFLKSHGVELECTLEDIEGDRDTHRQLGL